MSEEKDTRKKAPLSDEAPQASGTPARRGPGADTRPVRAPQVDPTTHKPKPPRR